MAFRAGLDADTDAGQWRFWKKDPDSRRAVRFRIRRIDAEFDREIRKSAARALRSAKTNRDTAEVAIDRSLRVTLERAAYALLDSEHFELIVDGPKAATFFNGQLKPETPIKVGDTVSLDGRWTEEIKTCLLGALPRLTSWIDDEADKIAQLDAEEEEEQAKSFR